MLGVRGRGGLGRGEEVLSMRARPANEASKVPVSLEHRAPALPAFRLVRLGGLALEKCFDEGPTEPARALAWIQGVGVCVSLDLSRAIKC